MSRSVIVMTVNCVQKHPEADALRVYKFGAPGYNELQVIANLENVYEVGDLVYVALEGSKLKDGTEIKPVKLRNLMSYGMALGKVDMEAVPGQDFTDKFCLPSPSSSNNEIKFIPWPSIESFHNIKQTVKKLNIGQINYKGKVKLHGSNVSIRILKNGEIAAQNRSRIITPKKDNYGFAAWVYNNIEYFKTKLDLPNCDVTIYGEFAGAGIQNKVAVSKLDKKIFAIFAVQLGGFDGNIAKLIVEPQFIEQIFVEKHDDIYVLPWHGPEFKFRMYDSNQVNSEIKRLEDLLSEIEKEDPWVKENFGISGLGEGLVMYPFPERQEIDKYLFSELVFKIKGEKHKVVKTNVKIPIDPQISKNIEEFVNMFVTEARLEQGLVESGTQDFDMKNMGSFIKWINLDIKKESVAELESSKLEWKNVSKAISNKARDWYMNKCLT